MNLGIWEDYGMGLRNKKKERLERLDSKTLDAKFLHEIKHGLNCSPFEAEAVLDVVKEVYFPYLDEHSTKAPPGKVGLVVVDADEPAGKPVSSSPIGTPGTGVASITMAMTPNSSTKR